MVLTLFNRCLSYLKFKRGFVRKPPNHTQGRHKLKFLFSIFLFETKAYVSKVSQPKNQLFIAVLEEVMNITLVTTTPHSRKWHFSVSTTDLRQLLTEHPTILYHSIENFKLYKTRYMVTLCKICVGVQSQNTEKSTIVNFQYIRPKCTRIESSQNSDHSCRQPKLSCTFAENFSLKSLGFIG